MKLSYKLLTLLLLITTYLSAQNEGNIWYFGNQAGLDFNSGAPVALTDGAMDVWEGNATISDANGNLRFYTNGITIWNWQHNVMANGTGLNGDDSSTQSGVIIPQPGNNDLYIVCTVDVLGGAFSPGNGLQYSVVDMSMNGGLGEVISKNNPLSPGETTEKVTAVRHCNNEDIWVIAHNWDSDEFYVYLVTAASTAPILSATQSIGIAHTGNSNNALGYLKASPDGSKLAIATNQNAVVELFDFDNATGVLSNPIQLTGLDYAYGLEFSPDNSKLFVSTWYDINNTGNQIFQYDLNSVNIPNSQFIINTNEQLGAMQLGPDGRIYVARGSTSAVLLGAMNGNNDYLGVIENPNATGAAVTYTEQGVFLGGQTCDHGLPTFIQTYFYENNISFTYSDTCIGSSTSFNSTLSSDVDSVVWNFGDMTSINDNNPSHIYGATGMYEVEMIAYGPCTNDTLIQNINIVGPGNTAITGQDVVCVNESTSYSVPANPGDTYTWSATNGTIAGATNQNTLAVDWGGTAGVGSVSVTVTDGNTGCSSTATFSVSIMQDSPFTIDIVPNNNFVCEGDLVTFTPILSNQGSNPTFQWQLNGMNVGTGPTYSFNNFVTGDIVTCIATSNSTCATNTTATSMPVVMDIEPIVSVGATISADMNPICAGETITFTATPSNGGTLPTYQWQLNGVNISIGATYSSNTLNDGDIVTCIVTSNNICAIDNPAISNPITVSITASTTASLAITADANPICAGDVMTFTAAPTNGGSAPNYQWQVNGMNVGTDNPIYTSNTLNDGDIITSIMTPNSACATNPTANSNSITANVAAQITINTEISATPNPFCPGDDIIFTATVTNGGANPSYDWFINGTFYTATLGNTLTIPGLSDGDEVMINFSSLVSNCLDPASVFSDAIIVQEVAAASVNVSITADQDTICTDGQIIFTATPNNEGSLPVYQWTVNGNNEGTNSPVYTLLGANNGDIVNVQVTSSLACVSNNQAMSNDITVNVSEPVITVLAANPICNGEGTAQATTSGGAAPYNYIWSDGQSGDTANFLAGTFQVTVTDNIGCTATAEISLNPADTPVILDAMTSNAACGNNDGSITLDVDGGTPFYLYDWSGPDGTFITAGPADSLSAGVYEVTITDLSGCYTTGSYTVDENPPTQVFTPDDVTIALGDSIRIVTYSNTGDTVSYQWSSPEEVSCPTCPITYITPTETTTYIITLTEAGGCTSTDSITISVENNRDLYIPNIFSPNYDGTNDVFMIYGGQAVAQIQEFRIYDRWGSLVHSATNVPTDDQIYGWDGTYKGKRMEQDVFVYFVVIEFIDGRVIEYKGDVTLVR